MDQILEIEKLVNHRIVDDRLLFEVKWKNLDPEYNVELSVREIPSIYLLLDYCINANVSHIPLPSVKRRVDELFELLGSVPDDVLNEFSKRFAANDAFQLPKSNRKILLKILEKFTENGQLVHVDLRQLRELREQVVIEKLIQRRQEQLDQLQEQEWWINCNSDGKEAILIANQRDLAVLPKFIYINNYIAGPGIEITNFLDPTFACAGHHKHCTKNCACMHLFNAKPAYNKNGLIVLPRGEGVHECNRLCSCDSNCWNRVVQKGSKIKVVIFRTATGTGWGVRALEFLPKGTFVGKYVGKVITWEEGELLSNNQAEGQYLFDIDYWKEDNGHSKYTVDAFQYGNFTRFINHSCNPNLTVYNVWIDYLDPSMHDIAFFTVRNIQQGEELTFNYRKLFQECKCGSYKCVPRKRS